MPRVFITQETHGRNFLSARHYGKLVAVLPNEAQVVISATPILRKIQRTLTDFSQEDYLLLSGDPIIMGLCMMVASEKTNGRLKMLKWEKREKDYYEVNVDYYEKGEKYA